MSHEIVVLNLLRINQFDFTSSISQTGSSYGALIKRKQSYRLFIVLSSFLLPCIQVGISNQENTLQKSTCAQSKRNKRE